VVSSTNSVFGSIAGDQVGVRVNLGLYLVNGVTALANGNYVVSSSYWNGQRGAATWASGTTGTTLDGQNTVSAQNSLVGTAVNAGLTNTQGAALPSSFLAAFPTEGSGRVAVGLTNSNQLTFALAQGQTVAVTPGFLTATLNAGTNVTLQASNDLSVNSPILVTPSGAPGNLTLQSGRSLSINANITTANGNLTLIANDTRADGVVDTQRDPGAAVLAVASGVTINTGAGTLSVDLKASTDKTNNAAGAVTLLTLTTGTAVLSPASALGIAVNGTAPGDGMPGSYTQVSVTGALNLNGARLQLTRGTAVAVGNTFTIAHTTGGVSGTFQSLPEGATLSAGGAQFTISYQANGGKDVVLTCTALYSWHIAGEAVGADGNTRLLWTRLDGSAALWSVNAAGQLLSNVGFGPYTGWTASKVSTGADGSTRLLWNHTSGQAAVWTLAAAGNLLHSVSFGPSPGWAAVDLAVGSDGNTRLLWDNADGTAALWSVTPAGQLAASTSFGPYQGWTAGHLAAGADGRTRLLWNHVSGQAALWLLDASGNPISAVFFGPYAGWTVSEIGVGADGNTRLLWVNADGRAVVWSVNTATNQATAGQLFAAAPGFTAVHLAAGADGKARLLWEGTGGREALWTLDANDDFQSALGFGPF
jgi:hypothetical protein